jgi:hypothetical protein
LDPDEEYDGMEAAFDSAEADRDHGADEADAAAIATTIKRYNTAAKCPLCKHEKDDPFHLFCECRDPVIEGERDALRRSAVDLLLALTDKVIEMILLSTPDRALRTRVIKRARRLRKRLFKTKKSPAKHMQDNNFVVYHMLTVVPFSARLTRTKVLGSKMPRMPLARRLGELFDATILQNRYVRPVANLIAMWASSEIARFADVRAARLAERLPRSRAQRQHGWHRG